MFNVDADMSWYMFTKQQTRTHKPYKTKSVRQISIDGNALNIFTSVNEAAKKLNRHPSGINKVIKGKQKTAFGFKWEYV